MSKPSEKNQEFNLRINIFFQLGKKQRIPPFNRIITDSGNKNNFYFSFLPGNDAEPSVFPFAADVEKTGRFRKVNQGVRGVNFHSPDTFA